MRAVSLVALPVFAVALGISSMAYAESAGAYVDDATITTKIKAAMATDKMLKNASVTVTTDHGTVSLNGTVTSKAQEAEAVKIANQTKGVQAVNDTVQVQNSSTSED